MVYTTHELVQMGAVIDWSNSVIATESATKEINQSIETADDEELPGTPDSCEF